MAATKKKIKYKTPLMHSHLPLNKLDHLLETILEEVSESEKRGIEAATENKKGGKIKKKKKKKSKTKNIMVGYKAGGKV